MKFKGCGPKVGAGRLSVPTVTRHVVQIGVLLMSSRRQQIVLITLCCKNSRLLRDPVRQFRGRTIPRHLSEGFVVGAEVLQQQAASCRRGTGPGRVQLIFETVHKIHTPKLITEQSYEHLSVWQEGKLHFYTGCCWICRVAIRSAEDEELGCSDHSLQRQAGPT